MSFLPETSNSLQDVKEEEFAPEEIVEEEAEPEKPMQALAFCGMVMPSST